MNIWYRKRRLVHCIRLAISLSAITDTKQYVMSFGSELAQSQHPVCNVKAAMTKGKGNEELMHDFPAKKVMPAALLLQIASLISVSLQKVFGMLHPQQGSKAPDSYPYVSLLELMVAPLLPEPARRAGAVVLDGACQTGSLQYE